MDLGGLAASVALVVAATLSLAIYRRSMEPAERWFWRAAILLGTIGVVAACLSKR